MSPPCIQRHACCQQEVLCVALHWPLFVGVVGCVQHCAKEQCCIATSPLCAVSSWSLCIDVGFVCGVAPPPPFALRRCVQSFLCASSSSSIGVINVNHNLPTYLEGVCLALHPEATLLLLCPGFWKPSCTC